jgi:hypothetical protein
LGSDFDSRTTGALQSGDKGKKEDILLCTADSIVAEFAACDVGYIAAGRMGVVEGTEVAAIAEEGDSGGG